MHVHTPWSENQKGGAKLNHCKRMTSLLIDPSTVQVHIDKKMDVFCVERTLNGFRVLKTMDGIQGRAR